MLRRLDLFFTPKRGMDELLTDGTSLKGTETQNLSFLPSYKLVVGRA